MKITLVIPIPNVRVRSWRWALLPLLALALILTWGRHDWSQRAHAVVPPGILINKIDSATGVKLAGSCYQVSDPAQSPFFQVCDDDFQGPPQSSPVCRDSYGGNLCTDHFVGDGLLLMGVVAGTYHVTESKAPPGYSLNGSKQVCVVTDSLSGCSGASLQFRDTLKSSQINITKESVIMPPGSCFRVLDTSQTTLFHVCDNDFQGAPDPNSLCVPDGVCNDEDPSRGVIRVTVAQGTYHVVESKPPFRHTADPTKYVCSAVPAAKCDLTVVDTPLVHPWFPWDVNGDGRVNFLGGDVLEVIQHFGQTRP